MKVLWTVVCSVLRMVVLRAVYLAVLSVDLLDDELVVHLDGGTVVWLVAS